jgi:hypothetical protein
MYIFHCFWFGFGRVVGGLEVLSLMERVTTDDEDRPLQVSVIMHSLLCTAEP